MYMSRCRENIPVGIIGITSIFRLGKAMLLFSVSSKTDVISTKRGAKGVQYHWKTNKLLNWRKGATGGVSRRMCVFMIHMKPAPTFLGYSPGT